MGENNFRRSNCQRINLQNIQAAYVAQYPQPPKKNSLIKKNGQKTLVDISPKKT